MSILLGTEEKVYKAPGKAWMDAQRARHKNGLKRLDTATKAWSKLNDALGAIQAAEATGSKEAIAEARRHFESVNTETKRIRRKLVE